MDPPESAGSGTKGDFVYATIRSYDDPKLADQLKGYSDEIESLISEVSGFRSYFVIRTDNGCSTVTICDDQSGTDESTKVASEWLRDHASEITASAPQISSGEVLFHMGATANV